MSCSARAALSPCEARCNGPEEGLAGQRFQALNMVHSSAPAVMWTR